jgi:undecaprenyl-diphosphatase
MAGFAAVTSRFPGDLAIAEWFQDIDGLETAADLVNAAGDFPFVLAITLLSVGLLLWTGHFLEASFVVLSFVPRAIRDVIVALVARPRPEGLEVRDDAAGFSFPSGHVVGAMLLYGLLFYFAQVTVPRRALRVPLQLFFAAIILASGPARVYVGVHWPSDALGGYLYGALALSLLVLGYRWVKRQSAVDG